MIRKVLGSNKFQKTVSVSDAKSDCVYIVGTSSSCRFKLHKIEPQENAIASWRFLALNNSYDYFSDSFDSMSEAIQDRIDHGMDVWELDSIDELGELSKC